MPYRISGTCQRVRPNNGILEVFIADNASDHPQSALLNVNRDPEDTIKPGTEWDVILIRRARQS